MIIILAVYFGPTKRNQGVESSVGSKFKVQENEVVLRWPLSCPILLVPQENIAPKTRNQTLISSPQVTHGADLFIGNLNDVCEWLWNKIPYN